MKYEKKKKLFSLTSKNKRTIKCFLSIDSIQKILFHVRRLLFGMCLLNGIIEKEEASEVGKRNYEHEGAHLPLNIRKTLKISIARSNIKIAGNSNQIGIFAYDVSVEEKCLVSHDNVIIHERKVRQRIGGKKEKLKKMWQIIKNFDRFYGILCLKIYFSSKFSLSNLH